MKKNKRGQVTLFIILAIIIVSAVLVFFLWVRPNITVSRNTASGFEGCVQDVIETKVGELGLNAGYQKPTSLYYQYQGQAINYLCYTNLYYKAGVIRKPILTKHFLDNLNASTYKAIQQCYDSSIEELRAQGYEVSSATPNISFALKPSVIETTIDARTTVTSGSTQTTKTFKIETQSSTYELLMLATSILQFESKYGDSDTTSLMSLYPDYRIQKLKQSEGTKLYIIEDKNFKTTFQFASRSYAWPAGYGTETGLVME